MLIKMDASSAAVIGAIVGSGITGFFGYLAILLQRRSEERRQIRQLAVEVAVKNWQLHIDMAGSDVARIPSLDVYLMHAMKIITIIDGNNRTAEQIRKDIGDVIEVTAAAENAIDKQWQKIKAQQVASSNR